MEVSSSIEFSVRGRGRGLHKIKSPPLLISSKSSQINRNFPQETMMLHTQFSAGRGVGRGLKIAKLCTNEQNYEIEHKIQKESIPKSILPPSLIATLEQNEKRPNFKLPKDEDFKPIDLLGRGDGQICQLLSPTDPNSYKNKKNKETQQSTSLSKLIPSSYSNPHEFENQFIYDEEGDGLDFYEDFIDPLPLLIQNVKIVHFPTRVKITQAQTPSDFYIKVYGDVTSGFLKKMSEWYDKYFDLTAQPSKILKGGQYVARINAIWHRVILREIFEDGKLSVQDLDDGRVYIVPTTNLRYLRKLFADIPMSAFHAQIQMIEGDEIWSDFELLKFKKDVEGKFYYVIPLSHSFNEEISPFTTLSVCLLSDTLNETSRVYTFDGRLRFGYKFN